MLFYVKKYIWLDVAVTVLLAGIGYAGIRYFDLPINLSFTWVALAQGVAGFLVISGWTFLVQKGYALVKGEQYAKSLTGSLAVHYSGGSILQAIAGGITAACGEELFFRGFIQGEWGIVASTLIFGLAHFGEKDIRIVSYWSFAHGLLFGLSYRLTGNLLVPMLAHGLFDLGGVVYFQRMMQKEAR
jgi:uncharacterized protein